MRIQPVGPQIGFWTMHWPWWRVKLRAAYCHLPGAIQHALEPAARRLLPDESCIRPTSLVREESPEQWVPPSQPDPRPPGLDWPSDQPPRPPQQIDIRTVEEPRDRESGDFFDFLI